MNHTAGAKCHLIASRLRNQSHTLFLPRRLLIENIPIPALGILRFRPGKDIEPLFLVRGAEQRRIPRALVLQ